MWAGGAGREVASVVLDLTDHGSVLAAVAGQIDERGPAADAVVEMALQFCRWDEGLTMVGLRCSNVMDPEDYERFPSFDADPMLCRWNLWGYIDARDGAQAVRRGLEWDGRGREVFVIANADTVVSRSSASLMAEVYPDVEIRRDLGEHETLLCIDKARRVLGYDPQHSWRDHALPSA